MSALVSPSLVTITLKTFGIWPARSLVRDRDTHTVPRGHVCRRWVSLGVGRASPEHGETLIVSTYSIGSDGETKELISHKQ